MSEKLKKRNQNRLELVRKHKDKPCMDCGIKYHFAVMDFDHREDKEKSFLLSKVRAHSVKRILEEIAKCDVVCANCHRMRSFKRKQHLSG